MKKTAVLFFLYFIFSSLLFARGSLSLFGGMDTLSMAALNSNLQYIYNIDSNGTPVHSFSKLAYGYNASLEAGIMVFDGFYACLKGEYIAVFQSKMIMDIPAVPETHHIFIDLYMIPLLGGIKYVYDIPNTPFSAGAGIYAGLGLAGGNEKEEMSHISSAYTLEGNTAGSAFVFEPVLKLSYSMGKNFGVFVDAGYRFARVPKMIFTSGDMNGHVMVYINRNILVYDYSGLILNIGLEYYDF